MPRTSTKDQPTLSFLDLATLTFPSHNLSTNEASYDPPEQALSKYEVEFTIAPSSKWTTGLHWHETHVELLKVTQGRFRVNVECKWRVMTPADEELTIEPFVRHEW
jgi:hypothetical protein